ncbi:MAG TPA: SCO family protein [Ktedonobacterales bacterium]
MHAVHLPKTTGLRWHLRRLVPGGLLLLLLALSSCLGSSPSAPSLQGTDLGSLPAPTFQLVDQTGATIQLSELKGHPVVLTFMYTHCPGPCPLLASKLYKASQTLGKQAQQVEWLAVSLDPHGDTPASATQFVAVHQLQGRLHFLLGTTTQLEPVWKAYFQTVESLPNAQGTGSTLMHSVGVFLLDQQGRERVYLNDSLNPQMLAADLHTLLAG